MEFNLLAKPLDLERVIMLSLTRMPSKCSLIESATFRSLYDYYAISIRSSENRF